MKGLSWRLMRHTYVDWLRSLSSTYTCIAMQCVLHSLFKTTIGGPQPHNNIATAPTDRRDTFGTDSNIVLLDGGKTQETDILLAFCLVYLLSHFILNFFDPNNSRCCLVFQLFLWLIRVHSSWRWCTIKGAVIELCIGSVYPNTLLR